MPFIGAPSPTRYLDKVSDRTTHTADGVQKSFAVKYDENHVSVFKNGMKLVETVDYLVEPLGQYVTLIQTPLANDMIECVGTTEVTDLSKSSYYRESFKPSANDQTITLETNINNSFDLNVYYNGIRLTANDYTVSITTNEITFIEPLREDDRIEVELFAPGYRVHRDTQSFRDLSDFDPVFEENQTLKVGSDGNFYFANTNVSVITDIDSANTEVGQVLTVKQDGTYNFQHNIGFIEIEPFYHEVSFSGGFNSQISLPFTERIPIEATWVFADIFMTASSSDHQACSFTRNQRTSMKNWVNGRGEQPTTQFGNIASEQCLTIAYTGEGDGFTPYYGSWYPSQWIPIKENKFWINNYSNSGSSGWWYILVKGYKF